jgi:hypothetical protein
MLTVIRAGDIVTNGNGKYYQLIRLIKHDGCHQLWECKPALTKDLALVGARWFSTKEHYKHA